MISQLNYGLVSSIAASHQLHLRVGVYCNNVVALWGLYTRLGMGLAVQVVLDEEVAPLLEVDATVVAHEAFRVVELVPGLHNSATEWGDEGRQRVRLMKRMITKDDLSRSLVCIVKDWFVWIQMMKINGCMFEKNPK